MGSLLAPGHCSSCHADDDDVVVALRRVFFATVKGVAFVSSKLLVNLTDAIDHSIFILSIVDDVYTFICQ